MKCARFGFKNKIDVVTCGHLFWFYLIWNTTSCSNKITLRNLSLHLWNYVWFRLDIARPLEKPWRMNHSVMLNVRVQYIPTRLFCRSTRRLLLIGFSSRVTDASQTTLYDAHNNVNAKYSKIKSDEPYNWISGPFAKCFAAPLIHPLQT